jgi:hypothetical protein
MKIFRLLFLPLCILAAAVWSVAANEKAVNPLQKIGSAVNKIKGKILGEIKKFAESRSKKAEEVAVETEGEVEDVVNYIDDTVSEEHASDDRSGETGVDEDDSTVEATTEEL